MLCINPIVRLISAMLMVISIYLAKSILVLITVYCYVLFLATLSRYIKKHLKFVFFVTSPIFLALLLVWVMAIDPKLIPIGHDNGIEYSLFLWLRIVSWGGILQFLFLPLVDQPLHLKHFLNRNGVSSLLSMLIIYSIIFLPEMHRRLKQIIDARRAQGYQLNGLTGLRELPAILMPLISSLLDSAIKRSELWSHRNLLEAGKTSQEILYSVKASCLFFLTTFCFFVLVILV